MAMSLEIPNSPHAMGINKSDPPAIPDTPHAQMEATTHNKSAVKKSTGMAKVCAVAKVKTLGRVDVSQR